MHDRPKRTKRECQTSASEQGLTQNDDAGNGSTTCHVGAIRRGIPGDSTDMEHTWGKKGRTCEHEIEGNSKVGWQDIWSSGQNISCDVESMGQGSNYRPSAKDTGALFLKMLGFPGPGGKLARKPKG